MGAAFRDSKNSKQPNPHGLLNLSDKINLL